MLSVYPAPVYALPQRIKLNDNFREMDVFPGGAAAAAAVPLV